MPAQTLEVSFPETSYQLLELQEKGMSTHYRSKFLRIMSGVLLLASLGGSQAYASCSVANSEAPAIKNLGEILHTYTFTKARYATGGVGLRNRRAGVIEMSGLPAGLFASRALLYWAVITMGPPATNAGKLKVQRLSPDPPASNVQQFVGTAIATGAVPCEWAAFGDRITVYRADVTTGATGVAQGNGMYKVYFTPNAAGSTGGDDPWSVTVAPLWEGASLVFIADGPDTVSIYDGIAGATFNSNAGLAYQLVLPGATNGPTVLFDEIGADGQHGNASRVAVPTMGNERTQVNTAATTFIAAGPGSSYYDSDWNGNAALPATELWDDSGHQVPVGANTTALFVQIDNGFTGAGDCLTPVVNVVQQP